ncbi:hypothetical protein QBC35DRAFT_383143 [Podospora australis]|uniref:Uncharacterized protein n=1 Tax=Podospora australis TaxID=1536484 RepID=A0AAN6WVR0_9PEZI|nr:hypothetical protein QBC35DRAFT_383143 [Podospora australis]
MTNPNHGARGPSLFQARKTRHDHQHQHLHNHHQNQQQHHRRLHSHPRQSLEEEEIEKKKTDIRSPPSHINNNHNHSNKLHERQVVVVQTVSVVQYIDATGSPVSLSTLRSDSPSPIDLPAAVTAGLTPLDTLLPSVSLSSLALESSDGSPSSPTASATASATDSTDGLSSMTSTALQSASLETLTSIPSSSASAFPIISSGVFNTTSTRLPPTLFTNSTSSLGHFSNTTRTSSTLFRSSSTFSSSATKSSSFSSRLTSTTSSAPTVLIVGGGVGNADAGSPAPTSTPDVNTPPPGPGLTPEARNAVVGGVVGSVAGIAIVALVLMFFLKWRKQQGRGLMLLGDGDSTARGKGFGLKPSGGDGGGMTERSAPFMVPSAFARLTGKRAIDAPPASPVPEEKGFYRVSGRKLRSVLESGGDGYSDPEPNPHNSISGTSYFRDSQAFLDSSLPPLQLGSPMRPESGVLVYHEGPQRTPVQEHAPFPPGHRPSAFPNMLQVPDQLGRSIATETGSRTSNSRFTEDS